MLISRAGLLRGAMAATALVPVFAKAAEPEAFSSSLSGGPSPWSGVPRIGNGPMRFVVIGDNTGIARPGVFDQAMKQIAWLQPDFVMSVGDLIEGYSEDRQRIASQWAAIQTSVAKLGRPFVYVQGNHDVDNSETLDAWKERVGPGYYSFTYKGALFIVLNTEEMAKPMLTDKKMKEFYGLVDLMRDDPDKAELVVDEQITNGGLLGLKEDSLKEEIVALGDRQLGWVRDTLAAHPSPTWTFVVLHRPAWKMTSPDFDKVRAMLAGRKHTVFAGHLHYFTHEVFDGRDYINMGTTGGIRVKFGSGTMDHVVLVTMGENGPSYANVKLKGLMDIAGDTGQTLAY